MSRSALQTKRASEETCTSCVENIVEDADRRLRKRPSIDFARFADMLSAIGAEPRLRIMHTLLAAHPKGMVVGKIQAELGITPSTLSHHLDKLRHEGLISVKRERKFLWYSANTAGLEELLGFLFSECCSRNQPVKTDAIFKLCR
jgi:ArsR family transcriptional regulator, arsenate/arsenite/antimonite-responsive transcriptional repressor